MTAWLCRPISSQAAGISLAYVLVILVALVSLRGICEQFQMPVEAFRCGAACLIVIVTSLTWAETNWMLDLEDEQTG